MMFLRGFWKRRRITIFVVFEEVKGWRRRRRRRRRGRVTNFHGLKKKDEDVKAKLANILVRRVLKTQYIFSWVFKVVVLRRAFIKKMSICYGSLITATYTLFLPSISSTFMLRFYKIVPYVVSHIRCFPLVYVNRFQKGQDHLKWSIPSIHPNL